MSESARRLWTLTEPIHALTYFAPEAHRAFEGAGLRGFWRGYFAGRAGPLGAVSAGTVTAAFFGFHPDFVARAIPSIWSIVDPAEGVAARLAGAGAALRRVAADAALDDRELDDAVTALREAVDATPPGGRPLFAANAALPWPDDHVPALWHAATLLREHRGDGHVAALVVAGVDPCEAHVLRIADDGLPVDSIRPYRGWSDEDWSGAATRLRDRGWLDDSGSTTAAGADARAAVEAETDRLSTELVGRVDDVERVIAAFRPVAGRIRESGVVPYPNPIGVPAPA
jgi:hypothetical protein